MKLRFVVVLYLIFTPIALYVSHAAPVGSWRNLAFDKYSVSDNADPDGLYLPSAVQFHEEGHFPFYVGTPGLPLHFSLYAISKVAFLLQPEASGSCPDFMEFCAKHWADINFYARSFCALVNLSCVALFFIILTKIGFSTNEAMTASLFYLFSSLFLLFFNKISPEGLMVLFFLLNWHALIQYKTRQTTPFICQAALYCTLTLFTKVHYVALLPIFNILFIYKIYSKNKILHSVIFTLLFIAFSLALSPFVDWKAWSSGWISFVQYYYTKLSPLTEHQHIESLHTLVDFSALLSSAIATPIAFIKSFSPTAVAQNINFYTFLSFMPIALAGVYGYRKTIPCKSDLSFLYYTALFSLPIALLRSSIHYYFFIILFLCPCASSYIHAKLANTSRSMKQSYALAAALSLSSLLFSVYLKCSDIQTYDRFFKPYYLALDSVAYGQRVGIVSSQYSKKPMDIGGFYTGFGITPQTKIVRKFNEQFAVIESINADTLYAEYLWAVVSLYTNGYAVSVVDNEQNANDTQQ